MAVTYLTPFFPAQYEEGRRYRVYSNTPAPGYIAWEDLSIAYAGAVYPIADGYTNKKFVWWDTDLPYVLQASDQFPQLGPGDALIFLNKNGVAVTVPGATITDGDLIVPGTILGDKIAANAITSVHIAAGSITADKIAANAVGAAAIAAGAVLTDHLAAGAVTADKIATNAVTAEKIAAGAVGAAAIAAGAIQAQHIAAGAITGDKIAAGAIDTTKLNIRQVLLVGDTWTNNSPSAGYIAWNAHTLYWNGQAYSIQAGSTNRRYVYWVNGATSYSTSDDYPSLGPQDFLIATNTGGVVDFAWNKLAKASVGPNTLASGAVVSDALALGAVTFDRIAAGLSYLPFPVYEELVIPLGFIPTGLDASSTGTKFESKRYILSARSAFLILGALTVPEVFFETDLQQLTGGTISIELFDYTRNIAITSLSLNAPTKRATSGDIAPSLRTGSDIEVGVRFRVTTAGSSGSVAGGCSPVLIVRFIRLV